MYVVLRSMGCDYHQRNGQKRHNRSQNGRGDKNEAKKTPKLRVTVIHASSDVAINGINTGGTTQYHQRLTIVLGTGITSLTEYKDRMIASR
jgi:hypothetical protein